MYQRVRKRVPVSYRHVREVLRTTVPGTRVHTYIFFQDLKIYGFYQNGASDLSATRTGTGMCSILKDDCFIDDN